jgi:YfiR/HmsC-like
MVVKPPRARTPRVWLAGALLMALPLVALGSRAGAEGQAGEYELKAAFLYNFAKFVEWPSDGGGSICLGIVGPDPFGPTLERLLAGKTVHERPLAIRRFASADAVEPCHLLFVSAAAAATYPAAIWTRTGVLAVGEGDAFLATGGVIAFTKEGNKLRFTINAGAADRAQLKLSSQLLKLAVRVVKEGE